MKTDSSKIREQVRERYKNIVLDARINNSCCHPCDETENKTSRNKLTFDEISHKLGYSIQQLKNVPEGSNLGLGCGNPQAIAKLKKGEKVVDLGSGAGFDVFLAAKQVGNEGLVIGVDMTFEMISTARDYAKKAGISNVDFRLGEIENLPVADQLADVVISNCVINLSPEKQQVYNECHRILKPGGRLAISDVIAHDTMPEYVKKDMNLYSGCISGASTLEENKAMLKKAGFREIKITPKAESKKFIKNWKPGINLADFVTSATIEAVK